jgi:hypothetical protein
LRVGDGLREPPQEELGFVNLRVFVHTQAANSG